jgi:excisionase family DNA binding protein
MKRLKHKAQYISTGEAAKLLSVTPDTILRWVRAGKLSARKTAGGHNRISLDTVNGLLIPEANSSPDRPVSLERPFVPCWEYNSSSGKIKDSCRSCLVFKARGDRCFEVGMILKKNGHGATCCPTSCEECSYFKEQQRRPINVLIFTDNETLKESLKREARMSRLRLQFTSCEYDCSLAVDSFRPEYVIVDCAMELVKCEELCIHLANDPRIPWVKIVLAVPPDKECTTNLMGGISVIAQPFGIGELEDCVDNFSLLPKL